jgi:hypothetical protein
MEYCRWLGISGAVANVGFPDDHPRDTVARLYERPLVLVRPDGMVAWRGDALPRDVAGLVGTVSGRQGVSRPG